MKSKSKRIFTQLSGFTKFQKVYSFLASILLILASACSNVSQSLPTSAPDNQSIQSTLAAPTSTLPPIASPTAKIMSASLPTSVCSPLAIQPLDKLNTIITQPFIMPLDTAGGGYSDGGHHGLDLGFNTRGKQRFIGTPVLAAIEGKVASLINNRPPYGNMVMLETTFDHIPEKVITEEKIPEGDSLYIVYAHLQNLQPLKIGEVVKCGRQIAEAGLTGITSGPHLHFETRWGPPGTLFPVMGAYRGDVTTEEMRYYKIWRMSHTYTLFDPFILLNP